MTIAGRYQSLGDWAHTVGLPDKGGASGGSLRVAPGQLAIAASSSHLDPKGNSVRAQLAATDKTRELHLNRPNQASPQPRSQP